MTLFIAFGIILIFGYWSGNRRAQLQKNQKLQKRKKPKVSRTYELSRVKRQTQLHRIK